MPDNLRHLGRRRGIAAALGADDTVDDGHADARKVAELYAVEDVFSGRVLRLVHDDEIGRTPDLDDAAVQRAHARGVAGGKTERDFRGHVAERRQQRYHAQNAERLHAGSGRRIGTENDAVKVAHLAGDPQRVKRRAFVAIVYQFEAALAALADAADLVVGQGGVTAIDVTDHVGVGFQHHILVDQAGAGYRRAAGVDGALDAVFARPSDHLARGRTILDAAQSDFAEQLDAGRGQFLEVVLDHFAFDHRRAGMDLHAAGTQRPERALREDRHRFQPDHIARPAGHVPLTRRDHRGDAAVEKTVDPADLVLPRRPVPGDGMNMAVDQAGRDRGAVGIDDGGGAFGIDIFRASDSRDPAVHRHDGVGIEDRLLHRAREQQADVADHQFGRAGCLELVVGHRFSLLFNVFAARYASCARLDAGIKEDCSFVYK